MKMNWYRPRLREALARLAAPAAEQRGYLQGLLSYPSVDELALDLSDLVLLADQQVPEGDISPSERDAIKAVDAKLDSISGAQNAQLWTPEALSVAPEWEEIRKLAADALESLGPGETE